MFVNDGRVMAPARHLNRLAGSTAALFGHRPPRDLAARVRAAAADLTGRHRLRVDVVPGEDATLTVAPVAAGPPRPVTLDPVVVPGGLGPHKWRDRRLLATVASRYRGTISGFEQVPLLVDADGTVLEAAWGNVWILEGDALVTPPADERILPGVTRALLLELAPAMGLRPQEQPISLRRLQAAPVSFATSAIRLAVPATLGGQGAPASTAAVNRIRTALGAHC